MNFQLTAQRNILTHRLQSVIRTEPTPRFFLVFFQEHILGISVFVKTDYCQSVDSVGEQCYAVGKIGIVPLRLSLAYV